MRIIITTTAIIFCSIVTAQIKTKHLKEKEIAGVTCKYTHMINVEKKDTMSYVSFSFDNERRPGEAKTVVIPDTVSLYELRTALSLAIPEAGKGESITWSKRWFSLLVSASSDRIYLFQPTSEGDSRGCVSFSKEDAQKIINFTKGVKLIPEVKE